VNDALRALARAARDAGELAGEGVRRGAAEHPVCGDEVVVWVRLDQERVVEFAWQARGCPATLAVAAAAGEALRGRSLAEGQDALHGRLEQLGGLQVHERHAETLLVAALRAAQG
jgi:nitrogen fixation NifU-like protein